MKKSTVVRDEEEQGLPGEREQVKNYKEYPELDNATVEKILRQRLLLKQQIESAQEDIKGLNQQLFPRLKTAGVTSVEYQGFRFSAIPGSARRTLSKVKLLKYLTPKQLVKCYTKGKPSSPSISVTEVKRSG